MTHRETLLTAIKNTVIQKHMAVLTQMPHPRPKGRSVFEVYQYEEIFDDGVAEQMMHKEILMQYNQHLFEEEKAKLQMELFSLEEAIQIQENEIVILKLQIQAQRSNANTDKIVETGKRQEKTDVVKHIADIRPIQVEYSGDSNADLKDNSRLAIYPCVRVDLDPPRKQIPLLSIPHHQEHTHHAKSHRQMLATYTKRSLASSQEHPNHKDQSNHGSHEEIDKTIQQHALKTHKGEQSLKGLQRQIAFLERAWEKARFDGNKKQCKKYKQELLQLIGQFWLSTK